MLLKLNLVCEFSSACLNFQFPRCLLWYLDRTVSILSQTSVDECNWSVCVWFYFHFLCSFLTFLGIMCLISGKSVTFKTFIDGVAD